MNWSLFSNEEQKCIEENLFLSLNIKDHSVMIFSSLSPPLAQCF